MHEISSVDSPQRASLVSLNSEYQSVAAELVSAGGEFTPESEKRLDAAITALCQKADGYGIIQEQLESQAEFWKMQKDKCAQAEKVFTGTIKNMKDRMKFVLRQFPGEALQGEFYRFFLTKSADTLQINSEELPPQFMTTEIKTVPDRDKIEAALARGETVPGVSKIVDNKALRVGRPK